MFSFSFENKMARVMNKSCGPYVNKTKSTSILIFILGHLPLKTLPLLHFFH